MSMMGTPGAPPLYNRPMQPAVEIPAPGSDDPVAWIAYLTERLRVRTEYARIFDVYYRGDHPLPWAPYAVQQAYRRLMREARSNWAELIVDAVDERLTVVGFRTRASGEVDNDIWTDIWQANDLDANSDQVHLEALVWGNAATIVWPDPKTGNIRITCEHPSEVLTWRADPSQEDPDLAIKVWIDDWGTKHATLYRPDAIFKYSAPAAVAMNPTMNDWVPRVLDTEAWPLFNPYDVVPVVEFSNNPRMLTGGRSELASGEIDMIDRINETIFNRLLAAQFAAFRQRWVTGMEIPRDPETGQPVEPFKSAVDRLWMTENPDAKFGEFGEASLGNYISSAESDINHLAAISRTPPHYLLPGGNPPSGEALKAAETGLVAKVKRRQRFFGESWEDTIQLALLMSGSPEASDEATEIIWADPESRSDAQRADALSKLAALGVPEEALWELSGFFSPQQIERMKAMREEEAALVPLGPPTLIPAAEPVPGGPPAPTALPPAPSPAPPSRK